MAFLHVPVKHKQEQAQIKQAQIKQAQIKQEQASTN
jgi:hypothetical protein